MAELPESATVFAGLSSHQYHQWRSSSELFNLVETTWFADLLGETKPKRVLDLGCGTGIWINILLKMWPQAEIVGLDVNKQMLEFARRTCASRARFVQADAIQYQEPIPYDLIIAVLSADYIGFMGTAETIASNLAARGSAFLLFLDPTRYPLRQNQRIKSWVVEGRKIEATVDNFDITSAKAECMRRGLAVEDRTHRFRLSDGIERTIHCFVCTRT